MIPNCAAIHFELKGDGPATFKKPDLDLCPDIELSMDTIKKVNNLLLFILLDLLNRELFSSLKK
jgi:hypothetical protein